MYEVGLGGVMGVLRHHESEYKQGRESVGYSSEGWQRCRGGDRGRVSQCPSKEGFREAQSV